MSDSQHKSPASRWPARLRQAIMAYFSETDIQILCFDLGIDYGDLPGDNKSIKIVELIEYLARKGKISELIDQCSQYRPNVPWDEFRAAAIQHPLVFEYGKANQVIQIPPRAPQREPPTTLPQVGQLARFTQPRLVMVAAIVLIVIALIAGTLLLRTETPTEETAKELTLEPGATRIRPADGMVMVYVPAGEFEMGSDDDELDYALELCNECFGDCQPGWFEDEQPAHTVALDGFWIDQTEVTNAQYRQCVEAGACEPPACWDNSDCNAPNQPVVCVNWYQAQAYCEWVGGRLPTDAEWEYAACGSEGSRYPWGDEFDGTQCNYCDANCKLDHRDETLDDGYAYTARVGSYPAGASWCGAQDMGGNAWEWVADWYGDYPSGRQVNPTGPSTGTYRVRRGGSWSSDRGDARCTCRVGDRPSEFGRGLGFRVVFPGSIPTDF
jgi:formylglycine-generating enzyme required for sulfatase activity